MLERLKLLRRAWKYRLQDDPAEIAFLLRNIQKGATVFDVGAHKGGYTWWMQQAVGHHGLVVAFEPQPKGAALLKQLFAKEHVIVEAIALSATNGVQTFFIQPQSYDVSFEASLEPKYDTAKELSVPTETIDSYCARTARFPSFIKIDVEGHELAVLEGAASLLKKHRPVILVEAEHRHIGAKGWNAFIALMKAHRYQGSFFNNGKQESIRTFDPSVHQHIQNLPQHKSRYCNNFAFEPLT